MTDTWETNLADHTFGFEMALAAIRQNLKLMRKGWNGVGMWVALSPGFTLQASGVFSPAISAELRKTDEPGQFRPYLMMRTAQGDYVPWVASQTDILADDWQLVP